MLMQGVSEDDFQSSIRDAFSKMNGNDDFDDDDEGDDFFDDDDDENDDNGNGDDSEKGNHDSNISN